MGTKKGYRSPFKGIFSDPIPRFWNLVIKGTTPDGCWDWKGWKNPEGYGYLAVEGKDVRAHRFSYILHKGEIPTGLFVCHSCDNPSCTNPLHLWLGDNSQNMRDMRRKGRQNDTGKAQGSLNGRSKLIKKDIQYIRNSFAEKKHTKTELSKMFKTSYSNVAGIISHIYWKWVE